MSMKTKDKCKKSMRTLGAALVAARRQPQRVRLQDAGTKRECLVRPNGAYHQRVEVPPR